MSLVVNIYYKGENGNAQKFAQEMIDSGIVAKIKAEAGNIRYDYFVPFNDPETILLIDEWENQEAIDVHHATPMMGQIAALREKYDLHMTVYKMVYDPNLDNEKDKAFIKE